MGIKVIARPGEPIDSLIKRFTSVVLKSGILKDYLEKMYYIKPSELKRKKRYARIVKNRMKKGRVDTFGALKRSLKEKREDMFFENLLKEENENLESRYEEENYGDNEI